MTAKVLTKAIIAAAGKPVTWQPCLITSTSPLEVTLAGEPNIPGQPITGATYTVGATAYALTVSPAPPVILPIG